MSKYLNIVIFLFSFSALSKNWKPLLSIEGIEVLGAERTEMGLIPFKAVAELDGTLEAVYDILVDMENKARWSPKLYFTKIHQKISENDYIFSEYYSTPWPAYDREFLMMGNIEKGENYFLLTAKSVIDENFLNDRLVQADVQKLAIMVKKISKNKLQIEFEFLGHMQGWMPVWLINIIQKKWPLRFIQGLRKEIELRKN
jgi:hypothetical protein